jgi:DNA-directed RNA polymerase subunit RPC12/RpoP
MEYTDDDFNLRLPNNNSMLNAKKKEVTWTGYKCKECGASGTSPGYSEFERCPICLSFNIERFDSSDGKRFWKPKEKHMCELEGPYECPWCGGHIMLDATYLDQVGLRVKCPYCDRYVYTEET